MATAQQRRLPLPDRRDVAFVVRAKTGPGPRDWSAVGVGFARKDDAPGFTIKINTWPIDTANFKGALVLVPPFVNKDEPIDE